MEGQKAQGEAELGVRVFTCEDRSLAVKVEMRRKDHESTEYTLSHLVLAEAKSWGVTWRKSAVKS